MIAALFRRIRARRAARALPRDLTRIEQRDLANWERYRP